MNKRSSTVRLAAAAISACLAAIALIQSSRPAAEDSLQQPMQVAVRIASIDSQRIIAARPVVDAAQTVLVSSDNHTDGEASRQALNDAITRVNTELTQAMTDLAAFPTESRSAENAKTNSDVARFVTAGMRDFSGIAVDLSSLATAESAVEAAVTAHTTELQAAARVAAESYHLAVWTTGFQSQLNACRGAVNLSAAYGVRVIGEKWECGGARFPREGSLVSLSGIFAGLYRVGPTVAVLSAYTNTTRDIPRGYALLYQTCRNGNAHTETFAELIPVP